jgi:hypothetical protein
VYGIIGGLAVYSQAIGNANQEAEIPLENRNARGYVVPFDNTNGSATGIALANVSPQAVNSAITIRDDTGAVLQDVITLPAMGHTSFNLTDRYASVTARRNSGIQDAVSGLKVYDARLVAVSIVYGLKSIVTFNVEDFRRFGEIEVIHPRDAITRG